MHSCKWVDLIDRNMGDGLFKWTCLLIRISFWMGCRLWNTTLMEDFPGIHTVRIRSKAHISLDPAMEITQRIDDDYDHVIQPLNDSKLTNWKLEAQSMESVHDTNPLQAFRSKLRRNPSWNESINIVWLWRRRRWRILTDWTRVSRQKFHCGSS